MGEQSQPDRPFHEVLNEFLDRNQITIDDLSKWVDTPKNVLIAMLNGDHPAPTNLVFYYLLSKHTHGVAALMKAADVQVYGL